MRNYFPKLLWEWREYGYDRGGTRAFYIEFWLFNHSISFEIVYV